MIPIFIFSLPRAGSTLLQRILSSHTQICSTAEPWVLLPYIYARKEKGLLAEYSHHLGYKAYNEFIEKLPKKDQDYNPLLRDFIISLYAKQCRNNEIYFLDKTPRYYLIIPEIIEIFPEAKFIFLFRNPAHVFASIISTFCKGRLNRLHGNLIDFQTGPSALATGYRLLVNKSYKLQYEDLVKDPELHTKEIFNYLGIQNEPSVVDQFCDTTFSGSMGDLTGINKYSSISTDSLLTWTEIINSATRKRLLVHLLSSIDSATFTTHGYSRKSVIDEVISLNTNAIGIRDMLDISLSKIVTTLNLNLYFSRENKWTHSRYLR